MPQAQPSPTLRTAAVPGAGLTAAGVRHLPDNEAVKALLDELDSVIRSKTQENRVYGHIFNGGNMEQPLAYLAALRSYSGPASRICEIGFAGGHSATVMMYAKPGAVYQAFDMWDRPFYEDAALAKVRAMFPGRPFDIFRGDSTKTVPSYSNMCDIIHVDGAHHDNFPAQDLRNMERLANPAGHLLLVDDCTSSFPAVLNAWNALKQAGKVVEHKAVKPAGWSYRGAQKGWCIGEYTLALAPAPASSPPQALSKEEVAAREADEAAIVPLLRDLDSVVRSHAPADKVYGHIFNGGNLAQPLSYMSALRHYSGPAKRICEIGFAGGHSATILLHALPDAEYQAFDMWDRPYYEDAALAKVRAMFPGRSISLKKGDSTKTVPKYKGECDIIHIDGAHHDHFPRVDMANMARLANPAGHLLLIDDCVSSFPAVLHAWEDLAARGQVVQYAQELPDGWSFRGAQKGWCIGAYAHGAKHFQASPPAAPASPPQGAGERFRMFLGLKFCNVGWGGADCSTPMPKPPCGPRDDRCFYHPEYGTAAVSRERWQGAQSVEQETWDTRDTDEDRNEAHKVSYQGYTSLPADMGDTVEVACGPFTQVKTILASGHTAKSLTLLDPGTFHYMTNVRRSSFKAGLLSAPGVRENTVLSFPAEEIPDLTHAFDTVIMINVIEHVLDAFTTFEKVYHMLRPGGLFVWHDRLWDAYKGVPDHEREFQLHPIRLKTSFANRFAGLFDTVYDTRDTPELRRLKNQGIYFIGRKRASLPGLPAVAPPAPEPGRLTVVLATHPGSLRAADLRANIAAYHAMPIVRYIVLVLNGAPAPFDLEPFASKLILKAFATNSMNNRFRVSREVLTEAVLIVDDDIKLAEPLLRCMHTHWSRDKQRLFGLDPKAVHEGAYQFHPNRRGEYSVVVGKTMLFRREYLDTYLDDKQVTAYVNPEGQAPGGELHFCEDLAMVAMVAKLSGKPPMAINPGSLRVDLDNRGSSLSLASDWTDMRMACVRWLEAHHGFTLPVERTQLKCPA